MLNIGIICPSEIAERRFLPALKEVKNVKFVGIGVAKEEERYGTFRKSESTQRNRAERIINEFGGELFEGYDTIVTSDKVDAVYIPLPPALHFKWAKLALQSGKHVLVEKPSTLCERESIELVKIAQKNNLALHENYMFVFHEQIKILNNIISSGTLGNIRLSRICFGFPFRGDCDFRYNKELGGGALVDAGGYVIKYAMMMLGENAKVAYAKLNKAREYDVDIYGSGALVNEKGETIQIAFGMDNDYRCDLEVWGSEASLTTGRVLTAPVGYTPKAYIKRGNKTEEVILPEDDSFKKSIEHFTQCILNKNIREKTYCDIIKQAQMVDEFKSKSIIWE